MSSAVALGGARLRSPHCDARNTGSVGAFGQSIKCRAGAEGVRAHTIRLFPVQRCAHVWGERCKDDGPAAHLPLERRGVVNGAQDGVDDIIAVELVPQRVPPLHPERGVRNLHTNAERGRDELHARPTLVSIARATDLGEIGLD